MTLQHPPATHVYLMDGLVYRIDELTIEQARAVIIRLCDELETEREKRSAGDGFRR